jgi:hypothetical protein
MAMAVTYIVHLNIFDCNCLLLTDVELRTLPITLQGKGDDIPYSAGNFERDILSDLIVCELG